MIVNDVASKIRYKIVSIFDDCSESALKPNYYCSEVCYEDIVHG